MDILKKILGPVENSIKGKVNLKEVLLVFGVGGLFFASGGTLGDLFAALAGATSSHGFDTKDAILAAVGPFILEWLRRREHGADA